MLGCVYALQQLSTSYLRWFMRGLLQVVRTRSLAEETTKATANFDELAMEFMDGGDAAV